jgi:hypothetical protein
MKCCDEIIFIDGEKCEFSHSHSTITPNTTDLSFIVSRVACSEKGSLNVLRVCVWILVIRRVETLGVTTWKPEVASKLPLAISKARTAADLLNMIE